MVISPDTIYTFRNTQGRGRGAGGGPLIFSQYVGSAHFLGFKILNFNIFGGFQKNKYFWGYEDFMDIFWGYTKLG